MTGNDYILEVSLNLFSVNDEPFGSPDYKQNIPIFIALAPILSLHNLVAVDVSYIT